MDNTKEIRRSEPSTPSVKKGKNYFLGIGINDYEKCRKLNNAVKDVEDFKALLVQKYDFEENNMRIVSDSAARREHIIQILRGYIEKLQPHDNFIFYFSGHGELDKLVNEGYWIPFEAETNSWHQYISNAEIKTYLNAMPCRHLFLIVDSCFSGALFLPKNAKKLDADRREAEPSRWALTAGRTEVVDDGEPGTNSPFAKWLLDTLKKNDKSLSVSMLCANVKELVIPNSNQTPRGEPINIRGHEGGEFIFHLSESAEQIELRIWQKAIDVNTEHSYDFYLSQYRKGRFAVMARQKLKDFAIEADYAKAQKIDKPYAYHDFLDKYEDEEHPRIIDAEKRIGELQNISKEKTPKEIPPQYSEPKTEIPTIIIPKNFDFEPEMVFVKGGTFNREFKFEESAMFGLTKATIIGTQKVTLSDFSIGKYPVTQAEWKTIMGNNPSHFKGDDNCPVENVSWDDCQEFIKKLSNKTNKKYRLPTEAEWEFAARGGNQSKGYEYSGSKTIDEVAWYSVNSEGKTHPVGTKKANELGIHDMSGNVWEWCSDWYGDYSTKDVIDPTGAEKGANRVNRGGSWCGGARFCRLANRDYDTPTSRYDYLGFRVLLSP